MNSTNYPFFYYNIYDEFWDKTPDITKLVLLDKDLFNSVNGTTYS